MNEQKWLKKQLYRGYLILIFCNKCIHSKLPIVRSLLAGFSLRYKQRMGFSFVVNTKWILNDQKDSFFLHWDYVMATIPINGPPASKLLLDKKLCFERCGDLMKRAYLDIESSSEEEILDFIKTHKKFAVKNRYGTGGQGFQIYQTENRSAKDILLEIKEKNQTLLEEYIQQHETLEEISPYTVNTLRIHTVSNGTEIRTPIAPKLRVGCKGATVDIGGPSGSYRLVLREDGTAEMAAYIDRFGYIYRAEKHRDTGADFTTVKIPFVKEAVEICKEAAKRYPETPYLGWDVAITPTGPVIVEGNQISGCFITYQTINYIYKGVGMKSEIEDMLAFAKQSEGIEE